MSETLFRNLDKGNWEELFHDPGTSDWNKLWFLDGLKATVKNSSEGMVFSSGPTLNDHSCHAVLWTKQIFKGDIKIEFDYTRLDDSENGVNILYLLATGKEEGPYTKDITEWSNLREVPYMRSYFNNMNLLHISYATDSEGTAKDYVRARRYPVMPGKKFSDTAIPPDYFNTDLFEQGTPHHFTVIKRGNQLGFKVETQRKIKIFSWDLSSTQHVNEGRIGIRHMWTRSSCYKNIKISSL